jgi:hypothetical protein
MSSVAMHEASRWHPASVARSQPVTLGIPKPKRPHSKPDLADAGLVYKNRYGKYSLAVPLLAAFVRRQSLG